jgi:hypothetical protein
MKKLALAIFAVYALSFAIVGVRTRVEADGICTAATYPTPVPAGVNGITVPLCSAFSAATPGATPTPFATATGAVLLVQPTNVPTIGVGIVTSTTIPVSGAFPTPIPFPTLGVTVQNTPAVNQGTSPWVVTTPVPYPTAAVGSFLLVAPTALPTVNTLNFQGTSPWVVTTPPPFGGSVTQGTSPWVVTTPAPYPTTAVGSYLVVAPTAMPTINALVFQGTSPFVVTTPAPLATAASGYPKVVTCDPTTAANCRIISSSGVADTAVCTTGAACAFVGNPADAFGNGNNTLLGYSFGGIFNGTTWDRARSAGVGNTVAATGLAAAAHYCEFLTTLPTLTNATYGAAQCDASGRLITTLAPPLSGTILTSASATACTNVQAVSGKGFEVINSGAATTVFPQFYNDAAATCAAGTLIFGDGTSIVIGAGQVIKIDFPVVGIAYKLSGALSANLTITGL